MSDPSPRSPAAVLADPAYHLVKSDPVGTSSSLLMRLTVLHRGTETLWQTEYFYSSATMSARWWRVEPYIVTRTEYRRVSP